MQLLPRSLTAFLLYACLTGAMVLPLVSAVVAALGAARLVRHPEAAPASWPRTLVAAGLGALLLLAGSNARLLGDQGVFLGSIFVLLAIPGGLMAGPTLVVTALRATSPARRSTWSQLLPLAVLALQVLALGAFVLDRQQRGFGWDPVRTQAENAWGNWSAPLRPVGTLLAISLPNLGAALLLLALQLGHLWHQGQLRQALRQGPHRGLVLALLPVLFGLLTVDALLWHTGTWKSEPAWYPLLAGLLGAETTGRVTHWSPWP